MMKQEWSSCEYGQKAKKKLTRVDITDYERTEFGLTRLFSDIYGDDIKFVAVMRTFYLYNYHTGIWEANLDGRVERKVELFLSKDCPMLINRIADAETRRIFHNWIMKKQSDAIICGILRNLKRKRKIVAVPNDFDKHSRYFALRNGILDMQTNTVIPIKKEFLISKYADVLFDPENSDTTWKDFLLGVFEGDLEMYEYSLRSIAYSMEGDARAHCLFMLYGSTTRNGKSTFVRGIGKFFAGYGTCLSQASLARFRNDPSSPRPDIAKLQGKRFVAVAELPKNMELDVAFVKALTGQDVIIARKLYQNDAEEFVNNAVFFLHMNRLPRVTDRTLFTSHRIIVIPFNRHFTTQTMDVELPEKLATGKALSGLLNEIIRVRIKYEGVSIKEKMPKKVKATTQAFSGVCDSIDDFLKSELARAYKGWIHKKDLYVAYENFTLNRKQMPIDSDAFFDELLDRQYQIKRHNNGYGIVGYKLKG